MSADVTFTPEQVLATPAGTLAQQPAELLFSIKNAAADLLAAGKSLSDHIDQAIAIDIADPSDADASVVFTHNAEAQPTGGVAQAAQ